MKTSNKIIAMGLIMACVACGAKKSAQSTMDENQQEMASNESDMSGEDSANGDMSMNDSSMDGSAMSDETMGDSDEAMEGDAMTDGSAEGTTVPSNKNIDYLDMYSELEMTDYQIQQFEGALTQFHTEQMNTPSGEMMGSLADERDRQLKKILTDEQYSAYENWKESN